MRNECRGVAIREDSSRPPDARRRTDSVFSAQDRGTSIAGLLTRWTSVAGIGALCQGRRCGWISPPCTGVCGGSPDGHTSLRQPPWRWGLLRPCDWRPSSKVMSAIRWLRLSYWVGAIADALAAVAMFVPEVGAIVYQMEGFEPGADYRYAMRLGASLMLGWTLLLLWADRKPLERRGVLPITVLVIAGLASAGAYAVSAGLIALPMMVPTWVLQSILTLLFVYSYFRSLGTTGEMTLLEGQVPLADAAAKFLGQKRFAVAGVSRSGDSAANYIFKRFRESGFEAYAINPNAETVDGEPCYPSLAALPARVDAVVVGTHRDQALDIARQCKAAGVQHVWFHRSIDGGSFTPEAAELCAAYGATVIPGGCPMMHLEPVDTGHRCMRVVLDKIGALPSAVSAGTRKATDAGVEGRD